jgi:hypothetical protein
MFKAVFFTPEGQIQVSGGQAKILKGRTTMSVIDSIIRMFSKGYAVIWLKEKISKMELLQFDYTLIIYKCNISITQ